MGDAIDREELVVYTQILRIPSAQCPPSYYELLGITRDERDGTKIEAAARKRVEQLRRGTSPDLMRAARLVLKKIERARTCLLDSQARTAYDFSQSSENCQESTDSLWDELDLEAIEASSKRVTTHNRPLRTALPPSGRLSGKRAFSTAAKQKSNQQRSLLYLLIGFAVVLILIVAVSLWPRSMDADPQTYGNARQVLTEAADASPAGSEEQQIIPHVTSSPDSSAIESVTAVPPPDINPVTDELSVDGLKNFQSLDDKLINETSSGKIEPLARSTHDAAIKPQPSDVIVPTVTTALSQLLDAAELPPQRGTDTSLPSGARQENDGFELGPVPSQGLNLTIDQPTAMAVEGISFEIISDISRLPVLGWEVRLRSKPQEGEDGKKTSLDDISRGLDEVVARVYIESGKLKFAWANSRYSQLAEQLRNCVLCLSCAGQTHRIQFRPYQKIAPVSLKFDQAVITIPITGDSLPAAESVFLALRPSPQFERWVVMIPETGIVTCNKLLTLKVIGDEEQQIEIRAMLRSNANGFVVAIAPRFRIGSTWQPLTTDRVNAGFKGLETALVRHKNGLAQAHDAARSLSSEISTVQSQLESARDDAQKFSLRVRLRGLQTRLNRANQTISRKERDIPETEHDLVLMKKLMESGNRLLEYAELRLRVGVKTADGEFNLLVAE